MGQKQIAVVMYHYVREITNSKYPNIKGLEKKLFEEQLAYIKKHFQPITMEDLLWAYRENDFSSLPERPILLTFDDGYTDHYSVAYPLLKKYGMQGAFFPNGKAVKEHKLLDVNKIHHILAVAPIEELVRDCFAAIDQCREQGLEKESKDEIYEELAVPNRWDSGEVIFVKRLLQNRLPEKVRGAIATELFEKYVGVSEEEFAKELYMDKKQICQMKEDGMFFGLHGYDHYWLGKLPKEQMMEDIDKAIDVFSDVIDRNNWVINYPYGNYNDDVIKYSRERGCSLGFTVEPGYADLAAQDPYRLPRFDTNDLPPKGTLVL